MPATFFRDFPPYIGKDPYVYLCFHESDAQQVKPILDALTQRRCRVWYSIGNVVDAEQNQTCANRVSNAALLVFYQTPRAVADERLKSSFGSYQASDKPVICIETQASEEQSGLSLISSDHVRSIPFEKGATAESIVSSLMRTEGFSQELIAEDDRERQIFLHKRRSRRIALIILAVTVLALMSAFFYAKSNGLFEPPSSNADTVHIQDPSIERAARVAISPDGNAALTEESLATIETLRLETAPLSFDELSLFPALTRLEIPQICMEAAVDLLNDASYTIVVYPEDGK